jgi:hypothetical protein
MCRSSASTEPTGGVFRRDVNVGTPNPSRVYDAI